MQLELFGNKSTRKQTNEVIKVFIEYAFNQSSNNARQYYIVFNKLLKNFDTDILQEKEMRLQVFILTQISKGVYYKDIYKKSKEIICDQLN